LEKAKREVDKLLLNKSRGARGAYPKIARRELSGVPRNSRWLSRKLHTDGKSLDKGGHHDIK
jgi:hypothetical protein